jgi:hypothetical protein
MTLHTPQDQPHVARVGLRGEEEGREEEEGGGTYDELIESVCRGGGGFDYLRYSELSSGYC